MATRKTLPDLPALVPLKPVIVASFPDEPHSNITHFVWSDGVWATFMPGNAPGRRWSFREVERPAPGDLKRDVP